MKIPIGLDATSKSIRFIDDVARGLDCDCICASCGSQLIARKGQIKAAHFAHYQARETTACRETAIHLMAKHALLQQSHLNLPYIEIASDIKQSLLNEPYQIKQEFCTEPFKVSDLVDEVWLPEHRFQPDILCELDIAGGLRRLAVEIAVTHKVDEYKLLKIRDGDINTVEIDLSDLVVQDNLTYEDVREAVNARERMEWVHVEVEVLSTFKQQLNAENEIDASRRNDEIRAWLQEVSTLILSEGWISLPSYPFNERIKRAAVTDKIGRQHQLRIATAPSIGGSYNVLSMSDVEDCQLTLVIRIGTRSFELPILISTGNAPEAFPPGSFLKVTGGTLPAPLDFVSSLTWGRSVRADRYIHEFEECASAFLNRINETIDQDVERKLAEFHAIKASKVKPECSNLGLLEKAYRRFSSELESRGFNVAMVVTEDIKDSWILGCPDRYWQVILFRSICYINNDIVNVKFYHKQLKSQFKIDAVEPVKSLTFMDTNERLPTAYGLLVEYFKFLGDVGALSWAGRGRYRKNLPYGQKYRGLGTPT